MGELSPFFKLGISEADGFSRKMSAAFADAYAQALSEGLQREHERHESARGNSSYSYDGRVYRTVAFRRYEDAAVFVREMEKVGEETLLMSRKVDGQYIVDVTEKESTQERVQAFSDSYDVYIERLNSGSTESRDREITSEGFGTDRDTSYMAYPVLNQLDVLGAAASRAMSGGYFLTAAIGARKEAYVLNGDTVIMDGEIVTDPLIRDDVLKQHRKKVEKARKNLETNRDNIFWNEGSAGRRFRDHTANRIHEANRRSAEGGPLSAAYRVKDRVRDFEPVSRGGYGRMKEEIRTAIAARDSAGADAVRGTDGGRLLESLERDFKRSFTQEKPITEEDLLAMNRDFLARASRANISLYDSRGRIDAGRIKNLSAYDLGRMGVSEGTRDVMMSLNDGTLGRRTGGSLGMSSYFIRSIGYSIGGENEGVSEALSVSMYLSRAGSYTRTAYDLIRRTGYIGVVKYRSAKALGNGEELLDGIRDKILGRDPADELKKRELSKKTEEKLEKKAEKLAQKHAESLEKARRKKDSLSAKATNKINRVKNRLLETPAGKALSGITDFFSRYAVHGLALSLLAVFLMASLIVITVIVSTAVSSFLNVLNPQRFINSLLAADTYADTAAYHLYEFLAEEEKAWISDLEDYEGIFEDRADMLYGSRYEDYGTYMARFSDMYDTGDAIALKPFGAGTPSEYDTEFTGYPSAYADCGISANTSSYGATSASGGDSIYTSAESGHTSNIKDIIAMADVMYRFDMDGLGEDAYLESVMGMTPAQMNWNDFCEKVKNVFKWCKAFVCSFWEGEEAYIEYENSKGATVSYRTLQNYAATLFENSHQNEITLLPVFHETGCKSETSRFKISMVPASGGTKVKPVISVNGTVRPLCDDAGKKTVGSVAVTMGDLTDGETPCIYDGMKAGRSAVQYIEDLIDGGNACWTKSVRESDYSAGVYDYFNYAVVTYGESTALPEQMLIGSDEMHAAIAGGREPVLPEMDGYAASADEDGTLADAIASICAGQNYYRTREKEAGFYDDSYTSPLPDRGNYYEWKSYEVPDDFDYDASEMYWDDIDAEKTNLDDGISDYILTHYTENVTLADGTETVKHTYEVSVRVCGRVTVKGTTAAYSRSCKGHEFAHCGGHLSLHCQGVVYSITNEQAALAGPSDGRTVPVADGFDPKAAGYAIVGKINADTLDYSTVYTASASGASRSPRADINGSFAGMYGLNLLVNEDGSWGDGFAVNDDCNVYYLLRDIFDIDTMILKGRNVFPLKSYKDYSGWTSDNMSLAIAKYAADWYEMYGFDIPIEIGAAPLPQQDIDLLSDLIAAEYGSAYGADREKVCRTALEWVGRGHFGVSHEDHAFLSASCDTKTYRWDNGDGTYAGISYTVSCTVSDSLGYARFVYDRAGFDAAGLGYGSAGTPLAPCAANALPGDLLIHPAEAASGMLADDGISDHQEACAIYLGTLSSDAVLSDGRVISAGDPIYCTIVPGSDGKRRYGTVRLRSGGFVFDWLGSGRNAYVKSMAG